MDDQKLAEQTVMKYLHINPNSDSARNMHFTMLENRQIGLHDGAKIPMNIRSEYDGKLHHTIFKTTLYFELDSSYSKVKFIYTD
jgi:hypothetical protein